MIKRNWPNKWAREREREGELLLFHLAVNWTGARCWIFCVTYFPFHRSSSCSLVGSCRSSDALLADPRELRANKVSSLICLCDAANSLSPSHSPLFFLSFIAFSFSIWRGRCPLSEMWTLSLAGCKCSFAYSCQEGEKGDSDRVSIIGEDVVSRDEGNKRRPVLLCSVVSLSVSLVCTRRSDLSRQSTYWKTSWRVHQYQLASRAQCYWEALWGVLFVKG